MNDKSKLIFAFTAGALVGAGVTSLLATDKGKELLAKAKDKVKAFAGDTNDGISQFESEIKDVINVLRKKGNSNT